MSALTSVWIYLASHLTLHKTDEQGAVATEYAMLVAFIAIVVLTGVALFGQALLKFFENIATTVGGWATGG